MHRNYSSNRIINRISNITAVAVAVPAQQTGKSGREGKLSRWWYYV
jgi:hypothetical protein